MSQELPLRHDLIRANAGTGKTFQLTNRFLTLLLIGQPADGILATTFTRKAASEIRERVFKRLLDAVSSQEARQALAAHLSLPGLTVELCERALVNLLENQHRLRIGTIDSLFQEIARLFFIESGLPSRWEVTSAQDESDMVAEALLKTLDLLSDKAELNRRCDTIIGKRAAAQILAELARHVRSALELARSSSPESWQISLVTTTPPPLATFSEAIASMSLPVSKGSPAKPYAHWVSAQEKLCRFAAGENAEGIIGTTIIEKILTGEGGFSRALFTEEHRAILEPLARSAVDTILTKVSAQTRELRSFIDTLQTFLDAIKFHRNSYSFDDIKHLLRFTAGRITELDLFFRLDCSIRHLLIDEFQDTSLDQWQVLEPLITEIVSSPPGDRTFLCVGDEKQSIYDWRGGTPHLFGHLESRYDSLTVTPLGLSFRSSRAIMDMVNTILTNAPMTPAVAAHPRAADEWIARQVAHATTLQSPGYVRIERLKSDNQNGARENDDDDDSPVTTTVMRAVELVQDIRATHPSASIGVLLRRNKYQPTILSELIRHGIAASGEGGTPLSSSPIIRALLALLTWIEHPADSIARFHVRHSPLRGAFSALVDDAVDESAFLSNERHTLWRRGVGPYLAMVAARIGIESAGESSLLDYFLDAAYEFDTKTDHPDCDRFVREMNQRAVALESQSLVRVMTIHKAKGLEFDAVILLDLEQQALSFAGISFLTERTTPLEPPSGVWLRPRGSVVDHHPRLAKASEAALSQAISGQLALLYVAITRPRHALYLLIEDKVRSTSLNELLTQSLSLDSASLGCLLELGTATEWFPPPSRPPSPPRNELIVERPRFRSPPTPLRRALLAQTPSTRPTLSTFSPLISDTRTTEGQSFGTAVHALCEQILWIDDKTPFPQVSGDEIAVAYLRERILSPQIRAAFDYATMRDELGGRLEVWRERGFALRLSEKVVSGTLDRVVIAHSPDGTPIRAEIYDFKTDRCEAGSVAVHAEQYRHQMVVYRAAVAKLLKRPESAIGCSLLFLSPGVRFRLAEPS